MSTSHGRFVWHELMTTNTGAAKAFYGDVVGWGTQDVPMPGMTYTLFTVGETHVSGLMDLPEDAVIWAHPRAGSATSLLTTWMPQPNTQSASAAPCTSRHATFRMS